MCVLGGGDGGGGGGNRTLSNLLLLINKSIFHKKGMVKIFAFVSL